MQGSETRPADKSEAGEEAGEAQAVAGFVTEICDDDYRSMFLPCLALEEGDKRKPER